LSGDLAVRHPKSSNDFGADASNLSAHIVISVSDVISIRVLIAELLKALKLLLEDATHFLSGFDQPIKAVAS
jgi:hypothetical protein